MRKPKLYVNGCEEASNHFREAQAAATQAGFYRSLGNFGPLFPNKLSRRYKLIETVVHGGYEYMIIESEVMSFSLSSMEVSKPHIQREAWFQPVKS